MSAAQDMVQFAVMNSWIDFCKDWWTKWFDLHNRILDLKYRDPWMMWSNIAPVYLDLQKRWLDAILPK